MTARLVTRLPLRTRARLRAEYRIDGIGARLVEHGHSWAAEWLWRTCRML
ncbi:hypothetical protein [Streptomyces sp. YIM S03343]